MIVYKDLHPDESPTYFIVFINYYVRIETYNDEVTLRWLFETDKLNYERAFKFYANS